MVRMSGSTIRVVALAVVTLAVGSIALAGTAVGASQAQNQSEVRLVHASPDAPPVDIYVDGELAVEQLQFGEETDYQSLQPGMHNITITEAGMPENVVFEQNVPVRPGQYTIAATGEVSEGAEQAFMPVLFIDDAQVEQNESAVRLAHLSPDAPAVDVTLNQSGEVLFDNVSFGNVTDYQIGPPGEYTLDIRAAAPDNDGQVVETVTVTVEGGQAYTAIAAGYLTPEDAPGDEEFQVLVLEDQTQDQPGQANQTDGQERGPPM